MFPLIFGTLTFVLPVTAFYLLCLLLRDAEAGFTPGVVACVAFWFLVRLAVARAHTGVIMATAVASALRSALSGILMHALDTACTATTDGAVCCCSKAAPAVILGFFVVYWLADRPRNAT